MSDGNIRSLADLLIGGMARRCTCSATSRLAIQCRGFDRHQWPPTEWTDVATVPVAGTKEQHGSGRVQTILSRTFEISGAEKARSVCVLI